MLSKNGNLDWYGDRSLPRLKIGSSTPTPLVPRRGRGGTLARVNSIATGPVVVPVASAHATITGAYRISTFRLSDTQWQTLVTILNECEQTAPKLTGMISFSS